MTSSEGSHGVKGQSPLLNEDAISPEAQQEGGRDSKISISGLDPDLTSGQKLKEVSRGDALAHETDNYEREDYDEDHVSAEEKKNDNYLGNWR